jgi:hypothetical protein
VATPALIQKFSATFDSYGNDSTFESYDPDTDRDRLDDALAEAAGHKTHDRVTLTLSGLEVRPYPYQQEMLDQLEVERVIHGRHRNLLVAATGTGKTVVAALDYRRIAEMAPTMRRLLTSDQPLPGPATTTLRRTTRARKSTAQPALEPAS